MMKSAFRYICIFIGLIALCPPALNAQVKWLESEYDYGTFREAAGPQKGSVRFVNIGSAPTFINSVRPSCGCTAAAYTESMIEPGDTATVSFIYNPYGRPGRFDKTVKVFIGKENEMKVIKIRGTVIGQPETLKTTYPYSIGPLRIEKLTIPVGDIMKGKSRHIFVNIYNQSEDTITPGWINKEKALEIELTPLRLAPGDIGTLGIYYRTPLARSLGPQDYEISLIADKGDDHSERKTLTVTANITPNPNEFNVDSKGMAGHLFAPRDFLDFGNVRAGEKRKFRMEFINDGNAPLEIDRVYCLSDAVKLKKSACKVKAGKKFVVEGELDGGKIKIGPFRINLEIISNDPLNPEKTVKLVGIREE